MAYVERLDNLEFDKITGIGDHRQRNSKWVIAGSRESTVAELAEILRSEHDPVKYVWHGFFYAIV